MKLNSLNKMVFHSHYSVTDKKTGIIHELCCYKECNTCVVINEEDKDSDSSEDKRNITNLNSAAVNVSLTNILANYKVGTVESQYRERHRAYRAAMMNKVPSGYSSDES